MVGYRVIEDIWDNIRLSVMNKELSNTGHESTYYDSIFCAWKQSNNCSWNYKDIEMEDQIFYTLSMRLIDMYNKQK